jgi:peptidoglycan/LPS O-acetylase OafA/YrhL
MQPVLIYLARYGTTRRIGATTLQVAKRSMQTSRKSAEMNFELGYRPALDGLRGLAILTVMTVHVKPILLWGGSIGVDIFFVLSGFLITVLLLEEKDRVGSINLKRFYFRRVLRLIPALVAMLLFCCLYALAFEPTEAAIATGRDSVAVLFYYFNWRLAFDLTPPAVTLLHTWSLSVEEQFYLVWPLLLSLLLASRLRRSWLLGLLCIGVASPAVFRFMYWTGIETFPRLYFCTDARADGLCVGCTIGVVANSNWLPRANRVLRLIRFAGVLAVAVLVVHAFKSSHLPGGYMYRGGLSIVSLSTGILLLSILTSSPRWLTWALESRILIWLGRISYSLYLWHFPLIEHVPPQSYSKLSYHIVSWGIQFAASIAVAAVSYYGIERWFLRFKPRSTQSAIADKPARDTRQLLEAA